MVVKLCPIVQCADTGLRLVVGTYRQEKHMLESARELVQLLYLLASSSKHSNISDLDTIYTALSSPAMYTGPRHCLGPLEHIGVQRLGTPGNYLHS